MDSSTLARSLACEGDLNGCQRTVAQGFAVAGRTGERPLIRRRSSLAAWAATGQANTQPWTELEVTSPLATNTHDHRHRKGTVQREPTGSNPHVRACVRLDYRWAIEGLSSMSHLCASDDALYEVI